MSDGSGGAPQLDERLLEDLQDEIGARFADYWQDAFGQRLSIGRRCDLAGLALVSLGADPKQFAWNHVQPRDLSTLPNAEALAASPGAGELDLTDEDHESFDALWYAVDGLKQTIAFSRAVSGRVSTANLRPAVEAFLEAWGATEPARVKLAKLRARLDRDRP